MLAVCRTGASKKQLGTTKFAFTQQAHAILRLRDEAGTWMPLLKPCFLRKLM